MASTKSVEAGRAFIRVEATADVSKGLRKVQSQVKQGLGGPRMSTMSVAAGTAIGTAFSNALSFAITKGLAVLKGIGSFFNNAVTEASHFIETTNKMEVAFKDQIDAVENWAKTYADSIGRSVQSTRDMIAKNKLLADSFGIANQTGVEMSKSVVMLAHDIGSLYDVTDAEAMRAVQSALVGQVESLKRIGAAAPMQGQVNDYLESLGVKAEGATEAQKMMARMALLLRSTKDAAGDAAKTMNTYANIVKRIAALKENLVITIGQFLIPLWETFGMTVIGAIKQLDDYLSSFEDIGALLTDLGKQIGKEWGDSLAYIGKLFGGFRDMLMGGDMKGAINLLGLLFDRLWLEVEYGFLAMMDKIMSEMSPMTKIFHGLDPFADNTQNNKEIGDNYKFAKDREITVALEKAAKARENAQDKANETAEGVKDAQEKFGKDLPAAIIAAGKEGKQTKLKDLPPVQAMKPYNMRNAEDFMYVMGLRRNTKDDEAGMQEEMVGLSRSQLTEQANANDIATAQLDFFKSGAFSFGAGGTESATPL